MSDQPKHLLKRKHAATLSGKGKGPPPPEPARPRERDSRRSESFSREDSRHAAQFASHLQSMASKKPKRLFRVFDILAAKTNLPTKRFAMRKPRPHPDNVVELNLDEIAFAEWPENNPEARATWMKDVDLSLDREQLRTEMYVLPPRPGAALSEDGPSDPNQNPLVPTKPIFIPKWMYQILAAKDPPKVIPETRHPHSAT